MPRAETSASASARVEAIRFLDEDGHAGVHEPGRDLGVIPRRYGNNRRVGGLDDSGRREIEAPCPVAVCDLLRRVGGIDDRDELGLA